MRCAPLTPRGSCPRGRQTPVSARTPWLGGDRVPGILAHLRPRGGGQGPTPHCVRRLSLHPTFRGAFPCPGGGPLPSRKEPAVPESRQARCPRPFSPPLPSLSGGPSKCLWYSPERRPPRAQVAQVPCAGSLGPQRLGEELATALEGGASPMGLLSTCPQPPHPFPRFVSGMKRGEGQRSLTDAPSGAEGQGGGEGAPPPARPEGAEAQSHRGAQTHAPPSP